MGVTLASFDEVLREIDAERWANVEARILAPALAHCAQSIEYSLTGYPQMRSALFRATIGRIAKRQFLRKGAMSHDTDAPIAGAPAPSESTVESAAQWLRSAIAAFRMHDGPLAPHLAYGACSREDYEKLHAMHIADHLSAVG